MRIDRIRVIPVSRVEPRRARSFEAADFADGADGVLSALSALSAVPFSRQSAVRRRLCRFDCGSAALRLCVYPSAPVKERRPRRQAIRRACFILKTSPLLPIEPPLPQKNLQKTTNFILRKVFARDWKSVQPVVDFCAWKPRLIHALGKNGSPSA